MALTAFLLLALQVAGCRKLNKIQKVQVSDTTGDAIKNKCRGKK